MRESFPICDLKYADGLFFFFSQFELCQNKETISVKIFCINTKSMSLEILETDNLRTADCVSYFYLN